MMVMVAGNGIPGPIIWTIGEMFIYVMCLKYSKNLFSS